MARSSRRSRGGIEKLPSGARRVRVYAGFDPVTKRRHYVTETVPPGEGAEKRAEKVRTRLLNEVDERRSPKTNATVEQLISRYLDHHFDGEPSTKANYRRYARIHVIPFIGHLKVGEIDADALDSLYAELRRCRAHCTGKRRIDHRTSGKHECDDRCTKHECVGLGSTTIRHIHFLLSGAYKRAVRWKWLSVSPVGHAEPPAAPPPKPTPPGADDAARLLNEAWRRDTQWGAFVWLAMTTGARRGELCALCWEHVDLGEAVIRLEQAVAYDEERARWFVKDTKSHQHRRIALDAETVAVLTDLRHRQVEQAELFGVAIGPDCYVFSPDPDGVAFLNPSTASQRYDRMAARLELDTSLHKLRHYSATELISGGVDPRTVAGRLGHGGGGATTLRVYSAWVSEADQRASSTLFSRIPERPDGPQDPVERAKSTPQSPYEHIAYELRAKILTGELTGGTQIPTLNQIMTDNDVAAGTAHRAISLLKIWGLVDTARGRPTTVAPNITEPRTASAPVDLDAAETPEPAGTQLLEFEIRHLGKTVRIFSAEADPAQPSQLRQLLAAAVRRDGRDASEILDYEMDIRRAGLVVTTFVTMTA